MKTLIHNNIEEEAAAERLLHAVKEKNLSDGAMVLYGFLLGSQSFDLATDEELGKKLDISLPTLRKRKVELQELNYIELTTLHGVNILKVIPENPTIEKE